LVAPVFRTFFGRISAVVGRRPSGERFGKASRPSGVISATASPIRNKRAVEDTICWSFDTRAIESRTIRKLQLRLIPFLFLVYVISVYVISFVDRINIGFAALTMNKELAMTSQQFGFAAGFAWQRNGRFMASQMSGDTVAAGWHSA